MRHRTDGAFQAIHGDETQDDMVLMFTSWSPSAIRRDVEGYLLGFLYWLAMSTREKRPETCKEILPAADARNQALSFTLVNLYARALRAQSADVIAADGRQPAKVNLVRPLPEQKKAVRAASQRLSALSSLSALTNIRGLPGRVDSSFGGIRFQPLRSRRELSARGTLSGGGTNGRNESGG